MATPSPHERGAILILVAIALFTLVAFSAIVVDYGILWASRGQAQSAADAGALAGAIALAGSASNAHATASAMTFAQQNPVWGVNTAVDDVIVHALPFPCPASAGGQPEGCVRVDVMRGAPDYLNAPHTNTLPVFFGAMLGLTSQRVRATATAQSTSGNAAECPTPWAIADKWEEHDNLPPSTDPDEWDQYDQFLTGTDQYRPPLQPETNPTGFTLSDNLGYQLVLKDSDTGDWSSGWSRIIEFGPNGGNVLPELISGCPSWVPQIGFWAGQTCEGPVDTDYARGCINVKTGTVQGPNRHGVEDLIALDDGAAWNAATQQVDSPLGVSPRVRPVVLFHPAEYVADEEGGCGGNNCMVKVVNIFGFFIEGFCDDLADDGLLEPYANCGTHPNKAIVGRMVSLPAQLIGGAGEGTTGGAFPQVIRLVR